MRFPTAQRFSNSLEIFSLTGAPEVISPIFTGRISAREIKHFSKTKGDFERNLHSRFKTRSSINSISSRKGDCAHIDPAYERALAQLRSSKDKIDILPLTFRDAYLTIDVIDFEEKIKYTAISDRLYLSNEKTVAKSKEANKSRELFNYDNSTQEN